MRMTTRRVRGVLAAYVPALAACSHAAAPDAFGNIEATEVVVSAQTSGQLLQFTPAEGNRLLAGAFVAVVDTSQLSLQRQQTVAQRAGSASHINEVTQQARALEAQREGAKAQREALDAQRQIAQRTYDRTRRLLAEQAATVQQLDQADRDLRALVGQVQAQDAQIDAESRQIDATRAQRQSVEKDVVSADVHVAQFADQIRKSRIRNPLSGTVLTTYSKAGEFVQPGQPLYKIANLDTVELRAYVTELQLARIRLGQAARISVDVGSGQRRAIPGTVDWIAAEAQFTPTPIQTRDERANLVYAVKIRVANTDGILKIGMPADVQFSPAPTSGSASR
jgi:HlyD family secretion protein